MNKKNNPKKIVSNTFMVIGLASAGCGAFRGFYDGMGIPLPYGWLENYLLYGPAATQSCLGIWDGSSIAKTGKQATGNYPLIMEKELKKAISTTPINGEVSGGIMGGVGEGLMGGIEILVGYIFGYSIGRITKMFS